MDISRNEDVDGGRSPQEGAETSYCSGVGIRKTKRRLTEVRNLLMSLAEGARFESPTAPETIGSNPVSSFGSQSLTAESEAGDDPIKPDRTR